MDPLRSGVATPDVLFSQQLGRLLMEWPGNENLLELDARAKHRKANALSWGGHGKSAKREARSKT